MNESTSRKTNVESSSHRLFLASISSDASIKHGGRDRGEGTWDGWIIRCICVSEILL